jgi:hypothetical protein
MHFSANSGDNSNWTPFDRNHADRLAALHDLKARVRWRLARVDCGLLDLHREVEPVIRPIGYRHGKIVVGTCSMIALVDLDGVVDLRTNRTRKDDGGARDEEEAVHDSSRLIQAALS